jgi:replicative DNA helicase
VADVETTLVWSAIQNGDLADVIARGVEADHFADEDIAEVYEWAQEFFLDHKQQPTAEAMSIEFPYFKARLSKEPTKYHLDRFVRQVKQRKAEEGLRDFFDMLEDPNEIDDIEMHAIDFAQQLVEVVPAPVAMYLGREAHKRKETYDYRKQHGIQHGIPMGIPTFDRLMVGMQPHELVVYAGPPGAGKTTGMQHTSINVYAKSGLSVLFVSLEVEGEQILRKFDTMLSGISYHALKAMDLDVGSEQKWIEVLERCEHDALEHDIAIRDDIRNCTVEKVIAEEIRFKPGLVAVDYLEEMRSRKGLADWESVRENARGLKQQARVSKVPHVTGTQINREGDTAHQSIHKIADTLIQLIPDEDDEKVMKYVLRKYRDGPSHKEVLMKWDLDTMDIGEMAHRKEYQALRGRSNGNKPAARRRRQQTSLRSLRGRA